jgi:transposase
VEGGAVIQVTPQMRIFVAVQPVDFRRGIDGLARVVREQLLGDPFSGKVFVFRNRRGTAIKVLVYDSQGFWLCHKRFSRGRLTRWPSKSTPAAQLEAHELMVLLSGGDFAAAKGMPAWRRVTQDVS